MDNNKVQTTDGTVIMDISDTTAEAADVAAGEVFYNRSGDRSVGTGNYMDKVSSPTADDILVTDANGQAIDSGVSIDDVGNADLFITNDHTGMSLTKSGTSDEFALDASSLSQDKYVTLDISNASGTTRTTLPTREYVIDSLPVQATDTVLGLVKTNPSENIDLNANGQLTVGGRLGQFSSQEVPDGGLYYPLTIQPEKVAKNSLLISEATGLTVGSSRIFALFAGTGVTLKSAAAAGATTFQVSNTYANRFSCAAARGGYATIEEATAGTNIVKVTKVATANAPNTDLVPYSGATESNNNIIITTDAPLSMTDSISKLRLYGSMTFDSSVHIGQGVGTGGVAGKGKLLQLGQSQLALDGNSILVGNSIFTSKNRVAIFGANHINRVQGACLTGEGHDTPDNGFVGVAAHGKYSDVKSDTAFAIGNGTSNTARSNLFEIKTNGDVYINGTKVLP